MTVEAVTEVPLTAPWTTTLSPTATLESDELALPLSIVAPEASTVYVMLPFEVRMVRVEPLMAVTAPPTTGWRLRGISLRCKSDGA